MLNIDNKNIKVASENVFIGKFIKNNVNGYNINIKLRFINIDNNKEGYLNIDAGFEKNNNIKSFLNKQYVGIPFESDIFFEIFDTEKFLDTEIESKIIIKISDLKDNKIEAYFEVNDKLIKIKYNGLLNII